MKLFISLSTSHVSEMIYYDPDVHKTKTRPLTFDHIPNILIHLTEKKNVESILKHGLKIAQERKTKHGESKGVYLAKNEGMLEDDAMDSYENCVTLYVDVKSFKEKLKPDTEWRSSDHKDPRHSAEDIAWYLPDNIPARFISDKKPKGYVSPQLYDDD